MKAKKPIKRKTPLKRGAPPKRKTPLRRGPAKPKKPKTKEQKRASLEQRRNNEYSKYWEKKGDDLWREIILHRAGHRCEKCGLSGRKLDPHHLIGRGNKSTRNMVECGICLCSWCHTLNAGAPHNMQDSWKFDVWLEERYPKRWAWIKEHRNMTEKNQGKRTNHKEAYDKLMEIAIEEGLR